MTPGRRVLLIVFLIFFAIGVLPLLAGNIAETFIYWFVLAVMCGGIAVLIGGPQNSFHPPTATATTPPVLTATTPPVLMSPNPLTPQSGAHPVKSSFFKLWAKCAGVILLVGCVLGAFAGVGRDPSAYRGCYLGFRVVLAAPAIEASPPDEKRKSK